MKQKIKVEILDQLLADYRKPEDLIGPDGRFTELKKCLINRVLESELTTHLGYDKHTRPPRVDFGTVARVMAGRLEDKISPTDSTDMKLSPGPRGD
jgi:hypothetical protein